MHSIAPLYVRVVTGDVILKFNGLVDQLSKDILSPAVSESELSKGILTAQASPAVSESEPSIDQATPAVSEPATPMASETATPMASEKKGSSRNSTNSGLGSRHAYSHTRGE